MNRRVAFTFLFLCLGCFLSISPAYAQFGLNTGFNVDLTLELMPAQPSPGKPVHITAHSVILDLSDANLVWYQNGKKIAGGVGVAEVDVVAGSLGSETNVTVALLEDGIETATQRARIHPTEIDLLWESDSYVPPYFRGRALPSAGTNLRLEAVPRFRRADQTSVPVESIIFTWRRDGYVVESVSGRGRSKIQMPSPPLFGTDTISVEARTSDGLFEGAASIRISATEPRLVLYEKHPLFGIMYHQAFPRQSVLPEIEMSFVAVPYFAEAEGPNDSRLLYEWRVNDNVIANDASRPSEITIDARGSNGIALIELALSHATNFFLNSSGSWGVTLLGDTDALLLENPSAGTP